MINCGTYYNIISSLVIILFKTGNCDNFEFLLLIGNVFSQYKRNEENTRNVPKTLYIINKYREDATLRYGPAILCFNIENYLKNTGLDFQEKKEILKFYNILKADVFFFVKPSLNDTLQLFNCAGAAIFGLKSYRRKGDYFKNINSINKLKANKERVGVIVYNISKINQFSITEEETFSKEIEFVKKEALKLQHFGVKIIIAYNSFQQFEETSMIEQVDIIIWNSKQVWLKTLNPIFSINVEHSRKLKSVFDEDGTIQRLQKRRICINGGIPKPNETQEFFRSIQRKKREDSDEQLLGKSLFKLNGDCKLGECSLGNMVTDAICYYQSKKGVSNGYWTYYPIALVQGDAFTADLPIKITRIAIREAIRRAGKATYLSITGEQLEHLLIRNKDQRNWTQVSGVHFYYSTEGNSAITYVTARCGECKEPTYKKLEHKLYYKVIMNYQMAYMYFYGKHYNEGPLIEDMVVEYIKSHNLTYHHVEDRYLELIPTDLSGLIKGKGCSKTCQQLILYSVLLVLVLNLK